MARIPLVTREQIVAKEKPAYDAFMLSRANRPNVGPYSLLLHNSPFCESSAKDGLE